MYTRSKHRRKLWYFSVVSISLIFVIFTAFVLNAYTFEIQLVETNEISFEPSKSSTPEIPSASVLPEPYKLNLGTFLITAYCPCEKCCGIWSENHPSRTGTDYIQKTASGTTPKAGRTISVDPKIIPFGTEVIIAEREYTAEDKGGNIKGNRIDIFFDSHTEALEFGRQTIEIYIIN